MRDAVAPLDLAPAVQLALLGAAVALLPLAWAWWRHQRSKQRGEPAPWLAALTLTTLILTFDLVLFGSFTRLTDSGLGCPDWPGCYGHATPLGARAQIDAAVAQQPDGPVTHGKAWIEMIHRYLAMAVGLLIIVMTVTAWRNARAGADRRLDIRSPWWATVTLVWVIVQGAFGALTVTMRLYPAIVTLHLLLGLGLMALLAVQVELDRHRPAPLTSTGRRLAWAVAIALAIQVALGGWVSTNYAVLACRDFPTCQGSWWPSMDFEQGFALLRPLGRDRSNEAWLPFAALTAIHVTHRMMALVVVIAVGWLAWTLWRHQKPLGQPYRRMALALVVLLAWQVASGVSNVVLAWPILAAVGHAAGAAGLVLAMAVLLTRGRSSPLQGAPS